jgi:hypothetical protein
MAQSPPKVGNTTLVGPYWRAIELAGRPVLMQDTKRKTHLMFQAGGRVSGHLFLSLMADGGIYEFEPATKKP